MVKPLDETDRSVLRHLQEDARITNKKLAEQVQLSAPGLQKRLRRLEQEGVVRRYATLVNREALGYDLLCFVQVSLTHHETDVVERFRRAVQDIHEVLECHHLTGEFDYLLKVVLRDHNHLEQFLVHQLTPVAGVDRIRTSVVLREVKATTAVPVDEVQHISGVNHE